MLVYSKVIEMHKASNLEIIKMSKKAVFGPVICPGLMEKHKSYLQCEVEVNIVVEKLSVGSCTFTAAICGLSACLLWY